jgi:hypothetical protein
MVELLKVPVSSPNQDPAFHPRGFWAPLNSPGFPGNDSRASETSLAAEVTTVRRYLSRVRNLKQATLQDMS